MKGSDWIHSGDFIPLPPFTYEEKVPTLLYPALRNGSIEDTQLTSVSNSFPPPWFSLCRSQRFWVNSRDQLSPPLYFVFKRLPQFILCI